MSGQGKYELLDRIGKGGMAELFRARAVGAEGFSKVLALKRILPELAGDEAFASMFIDEARVVSNLSHPNIVQVLELGKDPFGYFIAMELVNGPNLSTLLTRLRERGRRLPEPLALEIIIQVLQALDSAHRCTDASGAPLGIVHRDVSPQNVLISDAGAVKLGDFGIARAANRLSRDTQSGGIKGKIPYMAPEQIRGMALDGRTDEFAAGLVLWECLAGEMHYRGESDMEMLWKAGEGRIRPLAEAGAEVSPELEAILARALKTDPAERFPSCGDFARALTAYDRRTHPAHDASALPALVRELFGDELKEMAERLRRIQAGLEPPAGWAGGVAPIPLVAALSAPEAEDFGEPLEPTVVRRRVREAATEHLDETPAEPEREVVEEPPVAPPRMTAEELAAIDLALEADLKTARTTVHSKRGAMSWAGLVVAFALAGGGAWFLLNRGGAMHSQPEPIAEASPGEDTEEPPAEPAPAEPKAAVARATSGGADPRSTTSTRKRTERADESGGFGTLDITCKPECSIEIDGRHTGLVAPAKGIVVSAGRHRLRLFNSTLNLSKTVIVEVEAGGKLKRDFNLVLDP